MDKQAPIAQPQRQLWLTDMRAQSICVVGAFVSFLLILVIPTSVATQPIFTLILAWVPLYFFLKALRAKRLRQTGNLASALQLGFSGFLASMLFATGILGAFGAI